MKKRVITIISLLVLIISVGSLTGCGAEGSYANPYPQANCLVFTGYSDKFESTGYTHYYYDKDTKVMYAYVNGESITPLYNSNGNLVIYDEWLNNRKGE